MISAITCATALPNPSDGTVTFSSPAPYVFEATATYACNAGFALVVGDRERTCVGSSSGPGKWDGTAPLCQGMYCSHTTGCLEVITAHCLLLINNLLEYVVDDFIRGLFLNLHSCYLSEFVSTFEWKCVFLS